MDNFLNKIPKRLKDTVHTVCVARVRTRPPGPVIFYITEGGGPVVRLAGAGAARLTAPAAHPTHVFCNHQAVSREVDKYTYILETSRARACAAGVVLMGADCRCLCPCTRRKHVFVNTARYAQLAESNLIACCRAELAMPRVCAYVTVMGTATVADFPVTRTNVANRCSAVALWPARSRPSCCRRGLGKIPEVDANNV